MSALPWPDRVVAMSIHGDMANARDVERLASELMDARARLAEVEAERDEVRRLLTESAAFIGSHGVDVLAYEQGEKDAVRRADAAEARLARLRPVVRAAVVVESNTGSITPGVRVPMEVDRASFTDLVQSVDRLYPSDRAWALGEEER